ncbi:MAG TPA: metallophosphoesterase [Candidatus Hydrogenedentes bacterium]|jgi:hypothetical protein|nr:MAG: Calcineurin-like phosphoesterase [Candidatus Hydrogenedentes bacterium ADurb.Bin170]HNZ48557.1 metallophosphoesterase [Candidatus Hydrogenedentota bacterium]HOD96074.1 metallophosphoesterase [Candidatus Hydrogenedentota bacterium]HOH41695.1 metallophosphoesterase [Candidatus Hydrogenedentota bacterium]HOM46991.1 metallophosphoesterase [Candidatus Hydrogenedentota bacterium]
MKHPSFSRRQFMGASAAAAGSGFFFHGTGIAAAADGFPGERILTVPEKDQLRLLQFTDLHFFNAINKYPVREEYLRLKTIGIMRRLVDHARPDLIIATGDLWHENTDGRGMEFMHWAADQIAALGVPWTLTWGNHDDVDDQAAAHRFLTTALHSVYDGEANQGHHVVAVEMSGGKRILELFCLNSGDTGIKADALDFLSRYAEAYTYADGEAPLRMSAFHIPLKQYQDRWDDGTARGLLGEKVYFESEDGSALSGFVKAGISAIFCGHDHESDYSAFSDGIELIYGRATGYNGYGAETLDKGAKLYEIDTRTRTYRWKTLFPDGTTWQPGKDEHLDISEE